MDILLFTVGDVRLGIPLHRVALSLSLPSIRLTAGSSGAGTLDTTLPVVDLRHKFCLPVPAHEEDVRLIIAEVNGRPRGLVIDPSSAVSLVSDVKMEPVAGVDHPCVIGMTTHQQEPVWIFDWDVLLSSDTTLDFNDLFSRPSWDAPLSEASLFLEAVMQTTHSPQRIRQLAETHGIPLSVASRLATFYAPHAEGEV